MNLLDYKFEIFYRKWSWLNIIVNLSGFVSALLIDHMSIWIVMASISFLYYILRMSHFLPIMPARLGYANYITIVRFIILISGVVFWDHISESHLLVLFSGLIVLDGVDGYVARKFKQISKVGEFLDMEIDALYVFMVSYMHFNHDRIPVWILIPGSLRYIFGIIQGWISTPTELKPGKKIRSSIAVFFFISLLLPFRVSPSIYIPVIMLSSGLILISFAVSTYYLLRDHLSSARKTG